MAPIAYTPREPLPQEHQIPTYDYRDSMRSWDIVTQSICITISTICILLRLYSKIYIVRNPGWEDWTCCLAWMGLVGYAVISFEADKHGCGIHQWLVHESDFREFSKIANIAQITYGPLIFITKLSILLLYIRVFAPSFKKMTFIFIQLLIWFNFFFYLADTIVKIFECTPRHKIWEKDAEGSCININIPILITSAINVASDFLILLLPIVCVWRLQMKGSKKFGISAIFAAGSFGCLSSVVRLVVSIQNSSTADKTHDWFPEFLWTTAEVTSGIIASCLPTLPSCFRHFFQKAITKFSCFSGASAGGTRRRHHDSVNHQQPSMKETESQQGHQHQKQQPRQWSRLGLGTKDSEVLQHSYWELEDTEQYRTGEGQIFQGRCFSTAEAKADVSVSGDRSPDISVDGENVRPSQGILKTIEVNIESLPGQRRRQQGQSDVHIQGQGQGQQI